MKQIWLPAFLKKKKKSKTHKRLNRILFYVDKTRQNANFQGDLLQATNITKKQTNKLPAAGWVLPAT